MQHYNWKRVAIPLGTVAFVFALAFVGTQLRQSWETVGAETFGDTAGDARTLIIENADIWQRGCAGESLNGDEATVFHRVFNSYMQQQYSDWRNTDPARRDAGAALAASDAVALNVIRYRGFQAALDARRGYVLYSREQRHDRLTFYIAILGRMAELRRLDSESESQHDPALCGQH
jgi:hypothetical protein